MIIFEVKNLFGLDHSYFDTVAKLRAVHNPVFEWLEENCSNKYGATAMDNAAFSDYNEDPWVGYYFSFVDETDAMAFKLRWL